MGPRIRGRGQVQLDTLARYETRRQKRIRINHKTCGEFYLVPFLGNGDERVRWAIPGRGSATLEEIERWVEKSPNLLGMRLVR